MCGIAGMAGVADQSLLLQMLVMIHHRGPDDSGTYVSDSSNEANRVALGNNRLSILDLSPAGHQPMCNEDGTVWVVYNGEIYNFAELREMLEREGHTLCSRTDTEILPHLYEMYGPAMVSRLNGMFAFALWDTRRRQLFLMRDRMGIKPLYYAQTGRSLYFASEIKALLACPEIAAEVDPEALQQYLTFLYIPNPRTMFRGIRKLPPGHLLRWEAGSTRTEQYWDLRFGPYFSESSDELARELGHRLQAATRRQLISDVPVGFFLSGGIDSSTLVSCAAAHQSNLNCYSIRFTDDHGRLEQSSDDARFARLVAEQFGARFREILVEPDVLQWLPKTVWHLDDPVADPAAIATYLICRLAKPEVTVLLTGQGADEILGGYRVHLALKIVRLLRRVPPGLRGKRAEAILQFLARHKNQIAGIHPGLVLAFTRYCHRLLQAADLEPASQYTFMRSYFPERERMELLSPELRRAADGSFPELSFQAMFDTCSAQDFLHRMLYVDAKTFLPDLNLAYSDKMSMACSIEARVPFLDNEVVDFLLRVPPGLKIRGWTQKYLLKKSMRDKLPKAILRRRKAGFGLPVRAWIRKDLREMVGDLLGPEAVQRRGLFEPGAVARLVRENEQGEQDHTLQIWALLNLEVWFQTFVDQASRISRGVESAEPVAHRLWS